jgi:YD repeat-containing protein
LISRFEKHVAEFDSKVAVDVFGNARWSSLAESSNSAPQQTQIGADGTSAAAKVAVTRIVYDKLGRQVAITDANDHTNEQVWDLAGNLMSEKHADAGAVKYLYDGFAQKTQMTDAMGAVTDYAWDKAGRIVSTSYAAAQVHALDWWTNFQNMGLLSQGAQRYIESYEYDTAGRKIKQTSSSGANAIASETIKYKYDLRGNVIETTQYGRTTYGL